jgi:hypothetical protein
MPIQVKKQHHDKIRKLVREAKANYPERTWTSVLLADYVNEHYGGGITFKTSYYPTKKGNLKGWLVNNNLVDDDAKAGFRDVVPVYGVTDLAAASMGDLTQPLREDPHDPELITGYVSVLVDWHIILPGRNFKVKSRRFKTQREAYVHAVSMLANMARHEGQADQIDFVAVDPNDDKLRDDVLAAVQKMGARTEAEQPQEPRRDIYPGVSAVKMLRDKRRVVYATPPSGGQRKEFLATDIEDAKTFAGLNVGVQRLAQNAEVLHEIATGKLTETEAMVGMRAPSPVAEAPLPDEDDDATMAPPPAEANGTEMDVEPPQDAAATPPSEPAAPPPPLNDLDRDIAGNAGAARHALAIDAHADAPAPPPRLNGMADACADDAAAPRDETLAVVAERDALRKEVKLLRTVLAGLGITVDASTGTHALDLSGITLGPVGIDEAEDERARQYIPEELQMATQAFQPILDAVQGDHEAFFECIPGFQTPDDFRLIAPAHYAEVLGQTSGTILASTVLVSKAFDALDDNWTFDEVRDEVNRLARASGLFAQFVDRRLGRCLPNCPEADDYRDECWTLDFMIHGLEGARAAGLVLRPTAFADHWEDNMNYSQMVRYYYAGRVCTAVTSSSQASVNHRGRQRGGVGA